MNGSEQTLHHIPHAYGKPASGSNPTSIKNNSQDHFYYD